MGLNFPQLTCFSNSPEEGTQHKRGHLLSLPICFTGCRHEGVLQTAHLCEEYLEESHCDSGEGKASAKIISRLSNEMVA